MSIDGQRFVMMPSIGVALYPEHGDNASALVAHADSEMYRAKKLRSPCVADGLAAARAPQVPARRRRR